MVISASTWNRKGIAISRTAASCIAPTRVSWAASNYGEIAYNYVDYIGGGLIDSQGTVSRSQFDHAVYFSGIGTSIHDNFFGRSLSGYSGQIAADGGGPAMTIANNVFYGSWGDGLTLYGGENAIVTGNACISHPVVWYGVEQAPSGCGMRIYFTNPDAVVSGNYVEGAVEGLVFYSAQPDPQTQAEPGIEIVGNTSVGGVYAGEIDGIPGVMDRNQWAGSSQMVLFYPHIVDFADYLSWAQCPGLRDAIDVPQRDADRPVGVRPDPRRQPVAGERLEHIPPIRLGSNQRDCRLAGRTRRRRSAALPRPTPAGVTPVASDDVYQVAAGGTLVAGAAQSVLANDSSPNGETLTADWFSGPEHGQLSLNADGTFTYTPSPGFYGVDQFIYRVYDTSGGMAQATVTVNVTGALAAANDSYSLYSTSTLTVLAPGVLANATLPGGETVSLSASQPQYGTLLMRSDGSFDLHAAGRLHRQRQFHLYHRACRRRDFHGDGHAYGSSRRAGHGCGARRQRHLPDLAKRGRSRDDQRPVRQRRLSCSPTAWPGPPSRQWVVSGGNGQDLLEVDYSNGDPLPSGGGRSYEGGSWTHRWRKRAGRQWAAPARRRSRPGGPCRFRAIHRRQRRAGQLHERAKVRHRFHACTGTPTGSGGPD